MIRVHLFKNVAKLVSFSIKRAGWQAGILALLLSGCGQGALEFEIQDPKQDDTLTTVTATLLATETSKSCDLTDVTTKVIVTLASGNKVNKTVNIGDIKKGETATTALSIDTNGVEANNIETDEGSFTSSSSCTSTSSSK